VSGATFAVGSTPVTCTARDTSQGTASCSFAVTVTNTAQLAATQFVAFGDSITAGKLSSDCGNNTANCAIVTLNGPAQRWSALQQLFANLEESSAAYPRVLQQLLADRYASQSIAIANEGNSNEMVADGKARLPRTLASGQQVLLLMEGANDMNQGTPVATVADDLQAMVRDARNRGLTVFLGTLLPQRPRGCRAYDFCDGIEDTALLNTRLRAIAQSEGATLVDLYAGFAGQTDTLLGIDGLHPSELGYRKMAELFFTAVTGQLERRQGIELRLTNESSTHPVRDPEFSPPR
jgi:lysophospholipase L1-like esterase